MTDATRLSLKLPIVVAIVTGMCSSAVSLTAGYYLLDARIEANRKSLDAEAKARIEAVTRIEVTAAKAAERVDAIDVRLGALTSTVSADIAAMKVQQTEDGKKLDLLLRMAMERGGKMGQ